MSRFRNRRWSALAIAFGLAVPAARAEMITPDSIANPPSAVGSANGTPVYAGNFVTTQYNGVGLNFSSGAAITNLNGVNVWAPTTTAIAEPASRIAGGPPPIFPSALVSYYSSLSGSFVSTGALSPTTVSSLSLNIVGHPGLMINVYGPNGQLLNIAPQIGLIANSQVWTFTGPGIRSFSTVEAVMDPPGNVNPAWGVSGVSFTVASTPEPTTFVLAGLGALGMAARQGWRRRRTFR
jgi:hypothetical protein